MEISRKNTRSVNVGKVTIGGGYPVSIQSMTNTKISKVKDTVDQINQLKECGCDLVRLAVPQLKDVKFFKQVRKEVKIPLVADIHFDHKIALSVMDAGADKIRINPGNIGSEKKVKKIFQKANELKIPVRIGVNSGSLSEKIINKYGINPEGMVQSALEHVRFAEECGFENIVLSLKSSDLMVMIESYRKISEKVVYPMHLGVTEAGPFQTGTIKSVMGIGTLLMEGIGDTIRVSLTDNPVKEVDVAKDMLRMLGLRKKGIDLISCPTCGRVEVDILKAINEFQNNITDIEAPVKVAIMGCVVNGPGEAREADVGIAGGKNFYMLFKKGRLIEKIDEDKAVDRLVREINDIAKGRKQ
jgi:(E)-4-hydroxy-3-methylbut-2-enyl-diphosphate synthase